MSTKTNEVKTETKETATVKKVDIQPIIDNIPNTFTPATLDKLFQINDGGKTIRRHLRKHFAEELGHNKKDKWSFSKMQSNIIEYFANLYSFDVKAITTAK